MQNGTEAYQVENTPRVAEALAADHRLEKGVAPLNLPTGNEALVVFNEGHLYRVYLQPKVHGGSVVGFEALIRDLAGNTPIKMLEHAEEDPAEIHDLNMRVLTAACEHAAQLTGEGYHVPISVNIAPDELLLPSFTEDVIRILAETNTDVEHVTFEITERQVLREEHIPVLKRLHDDFRMHLALDDFGTPLMGEEALAKCKEIVETVKIDKSVVDAGGAVEMARDLIQRGFHVIIEGVPESQASELPEEADIQSFATGKPMSLDDALKLLVSKGARRVETHESSTLQEAA